MEELETPPLAALPEEKAGAPEPAPRADAEATANVDAAGDAGESGQPESSAATEGGETEAAERAAGDAGESGRPESSAATEGEAAPQAEGTVAADRAGGRGGDSDAETTAAIRAEDTDQAGLLAESGPGAEPSGPMAVEAAETTVEELLAEAPPAAPVLEDLQLRAVLEAIIYVAEEPLTLQQMAAALSEPAGRIRAILEQLAAEYDKPEHGITVREVAGGYKMATKPEHHEGVRSFVKSLKPPLKLSLPALETLAVIAYKQPVTAPEIMEIRGVQGTGVLKTLLDRKLIAVAGRKNVIGKPILYKTTKEFLIQFGLKDLSELPSLKEFEEIRRMALSEGEAPAPAPPPAAATETGAAPETPAAPPDAEEP